MTDDALTKGRTLQAHIQELERTIARLNAPGFFIELHENNKFQRSASLISTVGVGENCEHELAPLATDFRDAVVAHYETELTKAKAAFADL